MTVILIFFLGFFSYCLLGFLFYFISLGIYAKTGFAEIIATLWFQSNKTCAIAMWITLFPFWTIIAVVYFAFKILFFPIAVITNEIKQEDYYPFSFDGAEKRWDKSMANEWAHPY